MPKFPALSSLATRTGFLRFHGRMALTALGAAALLCVLLPTVDVVMAAYTYRSGDEKTGEDFADLASVVAQRAAFLLAQSGGQEKLDLHLSVWRTELLASHKLDRNPDDSPEPNLWRTVELEVVDTQKPSIASTDPDLSSLLDNARIMSARPDTRPIKLWLHTPEGWFIAAAPIRGTRASETPVLLLKVFAPADALRVWQTASHYIMIDLVQTGYLVLLIGWLASWFATRPLIQRLQKVRSVVADWTVGDLSRRIDTGTRPNELNTLTNSLNLMATQLEQILALRGEVAAAGERQRLMNELHDSVKQRMFALTMQISAAQARSREDAVNQTLQTAQELTAQVQRDLHRILSPPEDAPFLLTAPEEVRRQLEILAAAWRRDTFQVSVEVQIDGGLTTVWTGLEAIVTEALANAARHSHAQWVRIVLSALPENRLRLEITDNGVGFSQKEVRLGRGLNALRERAAGFAAGTMAIHTAPGAGCALIVECRNTPVFPLRV